MYNAYIHTREIVEMELIAYRATDPWGIARHFWAYCIEHAAEQALETLSPLTSWLIEEVD